MKLRTKLVLIAALLTLLGLALGFGVTYLVLVRFRLADLDRDNRLLASVIAEAVPALPASGMPPVVDGYLVQEGRVSAAQVFRGGELLWEGGPLEAPRPLDPEGLVLAAAEQIRTVGDWRVFTLVRDDLTVQVARPLTALRAILDPYLGVTASLVLALTLLASLAALAAARVALRPLETLTRATRNFDAQEAFPTIAGHDEAAALAQSFSSLLARLRAERERELRFMAYAAHELRTPVSALRASLEAARLRSAPAGPELLGRLHREARRLEKFTQNLLALSRSEAGELRSESLDLAHLAEGAYDRFQPLALERGRELVLNNAPAPALGDPRLLIQALDNLVINAVGHSSAGQIEIGSGISGDRAFLEVIDGGPGLPEPLVEGLGLRVVTAVMQAHGGGVTFDSDQGLHARLWLPAAAPQNAIEA